VDNNTSFTSNLQCVENEGATLCNTGDPQTESGTWSWSSTETILNINFPSDGPEVYTLVSLTSSSLVVSQTDASYEYTFTLGH
jgi:hypothetical protein